MIIGTDPNGDPFSIHLATHGAVWGKTGTGKTTLLESVIAEAIESGKGVTVIDPHGGLVERVLDLLPPERTNDVVLLDLPAGRIPGFNALEAGGDPALAAERLVSVFRSLWAESWGPRLEWLLQGFVMSLMLYGKPVSLVSLHKAVHDKRFRKKLADTDDPFIKDFFTVVDGWTSRFREEAFSPLINKVQRLSLNPHIRAAFGQASSSISFSEIIRDRRILLCKLPRGRFGEAASLIGSILVTKLTQAALARDATDRAPHLLVMDEVQAFTHGADLGTILAEARKFHLSLFLATQTLAQLPEGLRSAVFGNCGTLIGFRVSGEDGEVLHRELATDIQRAYFQSIPNYHCLVRTMHEDGYPTGTHLISASAPRVGTGRRSLVEREALRRWGRPRDKIERRITRHIRK